MICVVVLLLVVLLAQPFLDAQIVINLLTILSQVAKYVNILNAIAL